MSKPPIQIAGPSQVITKPHFLPCRKIGTCGGKCNLVARPRGQRESRWSAPGTTHQMRVAGQTGCLCKAPQRQVKVVVVEHFRGVVFFGAGRSK